MNALFVFASGADLAPQSDHAKLMEFWSLDKQIAQMEEDMDVMELFHSLAYTLLRVRAKQIILNLQK